MTMQLNTQKKIDRFAARIAVRLDSGDLPPGIGERLRQARQHALRQALRPSAGGRARAGLRACLHRRPHRAGRQQQRNGRGRSIRGV